MFERRSAESNIFPSASFFFSPSCRIKILLQAGSADSLSAIMSRQGASMDIPLQAVVSHSNTVGRTGSSTTARDDADLAPIIEKEKSGLFHRHTRGRRRIKKISSKGNGTGVKGDDGEEDTITMMGRVYDKFMNFSIVTRYFVYVAPLGLALAVPIIVGATAARRAKLGGVRIVWFFTWFEVGELDCRLRQHGCC